MTVDQLWELTDSSWREFPIQDGEQPSHAIIRAVGEVTQQGVTAIKPLGDVVDPGAVNSLCENPELRSVRLELVYEGCQVAVTSDSIYLRNLTNQY